MEKNIVDKKRFYYNRSTVYGWCVYDRKTDTPAYDACAELLPPVRQDESGTTTESPVMLTGSLDLCKVCAANFGEIIKKGA